MESKLTNNAVTTANTTTAASSSSVHEEQLRTTTGNAVGTAASAWPEGCAWPEPFNTRSYPAPLEDIDEIETSLPLDEEGKDLLDIKEYYDGLVSDGVLDEDYTLAEDYQDYLDEDDEDSDDMADSKESETDEDKLDSEFVPVKGEEYWEENHFNLDMWLDDITERISLLKIDGFDVFPSPVSEIHDLLGYNFINENLIRQAFTRRSFGVEHNIGNCEQLEFIGDAVLNTVVTHEITKHLTDVDTEIPAAPFKTTTIRETAGTVRESLDEGDFTKIRSKFVNKEYLASRAALLGLDKFILYGSNETPSDSAREDALEALIGAVAVDSDWNWSVLERVVDRLVNVQVPNPFDLLKATFYETFNSWHQKRFGRIPDYSLHLAGSNPQDGFHCILRFSVPENEEGISTSQLVTAQGETRSKARERAAEFAYHFVVQKGLWMNIRRDAGITPNLFDAINQLQELNQKGYVDKPEYSFKERGSDWGCDCLCSGIYGYGTDKNKTQAKKRAAFMVLNKLFAPATPAFAPSILAEMERQASTPATPTVDTNTNK